MPYVPTVVGRLHVKDEGSGPAVALWHSLLCDGAMWHAQTGELRRDHRLLVIDGPGHGRSEPPPGPFTLEQCAHALEQVLDARGVERAAIVGLSWGGMTAMRLALRSPERVRGLALLDTSAEAEKPRNRVRFRLMTEVYRRLGVTRFLVPAILEAMLSRRTIEERPILGEELLSRLRSFDRAAIVHAIDAVVLSRRSILDALPVIATPTLVVVGTEDRSTPPRRSERIVAAIRGARLVRIPGAGHLSALEAPAAVNAALRAFLASLA
jgi:3-oxoadipate enol-lactonase